MAWLQFLVGGIPTHLKNMIQLGLLFQGKIKKCSECTQMKGHKLDPQIEPLLISKGSTFGPFPIDVSFVRGPKTGPSRCWILSALSFQSKNQQQQRRGEEAETKQNKCESPTLHQKTQSKTTTRVRSQDDSQSPKMEFKSVNGVWTETAWAKEGYGRNLWGPLQNCNS